MKKLIIFLCLIHLNIIAISQSIIIGKNFSKGISVELISRLDTTRILSGGIEYFNDNKEWGIYQDKMIPVHISCTESEIDKIADFTINHYNQEAVTYYAISDYVVIKHRDGI